ncbi:sodium-coupled monocarboxylate transporter 2-like [Zophobas morio]|uniref:sodium-coupled monocarboxylate transporter 2-like n=1 Tax=Zophobas morio TaxID=2755281 RepID=UPI003083E9F1
MSPSLGWYDYIIFAGMLVVSTIIGIYFGCFGTKQSTIRQYLMGGKNMKVVPIAVSVAVSHISGVLLLVTVADVYRYGASLWLFMVSYVIMGFLAVFVYLPVFFKMQVTNIYEYLEIRFDKKTRMLAFVFYVLSEILMFPLYAYTAALTFATATGININLTATVLCVVCVFYTSIGGLKTVIWTDFLQFGIIVACFLTVFGIGLGTSGGITSVWSTAEVGGRLEIFNFTIDPTTRDSFWAYLIGTSFLATTLIVVHQTGVQKFLALPTFTDCIWSVVFTVFNMCLVNTLGVFIGLVTYSRYKDCDPLISKKISKHDQLFPYFVTDIGTNIPGITGLFIATIASASLSSISSNLNSLSGVIYKDFVCLFLKEKPEKQSSNSLKIIVFVVGLLCTCLVFAVERMGEIISITLTIVGLTQGPLLGIFTLGVLFPTANHHGAFYGMVAGFIAVSSIAVPAKYYQLKGFITNPTKPLSVSGCGLSNQTLSISKHISSNSTLNQIPQVSVIFKVSFYYYVLIGTIVTVIVGLIVSCIIKRNSSVDKNLLTPVVHSCMSTKDEDKQKVVYTGVEQALEILEENN